MDAPIYHLEGVVKSRSSAPEDFTGPLDLILHLLSRNRMEIRDIRISLLLEQYLDWMKRRRELDLEVASEFAAMASHLLYIKTRMLLSLEDEEARSDMDALAASLEERQRSARYGCVQAVLPELNRRFQRGRDLLGKDPEPLEPRPVRYSHPREDLRRAMEAVLERSGRRLPPPLAAFAPLVGREPYPVAEKEGEILRLLEQSGPVPFQALFHGCHSRSEVVATFLAVLELCRAGRMQLEDEAGGEREQSGPVCRAVPEIPE